MHLVLDTFTDHAMVVTLLLCFVGMVWYYLKVYGAAHAFNKLFGEPAAGGLDQPTPTPPPTPPDQPGDDKENSDPQLFGFQHHQLREADLPNSTPGSRAPTPSPRETQGQGTSLPGAIDQDDGAVTFRPGPEVAVPVPATPGATPRATPAATPVASPRAPEPPFQIWGNGDKEEYWIKKEGQWTLTEWEDAMATYLLAVKRSWTPAENKWIQMMGGAEEMRRQRNLEKAAQFASGEQELYSSLQRFNHKLKKRSAGGKVNSPEVAQLRAQIHGVKKALAQIRAKRREARGTPHTPQDVGVQLSPRSDSGSILSAFSQATVPEGSEAGDSWALPDSPRSLGGFSAFSQTTSVWQQPHTLPTLAEMAGSSVMTEGSVDTQETPESGEPNLIPAPEYQDDYPDDVTVRSTGTTFTERHVQCAVQAARMRTELREKMHEFFPGLSMDGSQSDQGSMTAQPGIPGESVAGPTPGDPGDGSSQHSRESFQLVHDTASRNVFGPLPGTTVDTDWYKGYTFQGKELTEEEARQAMFGQQYLPSPRTTAQERAARSRRAASVEARTRVPRLDLNFLQNLDQMDLGQKLEHAKVAAMQARLQEEQAQASVAQPVPTAMKRTGRSMAPPRTNLWERLRDDSPEEPEEGSDISGTMTPPVQEPGTWPGLTGEVCGTFHDRVAQARPASPLPRFGHTPSQHHAKTKPPIIPQTLINTSSRSVTTVPATPRMPLLVPPPAAARAHTRDMAVGPGPEERPPVKAVPDDLWDNYRPDRTPSLHPDKHRVIQDVRITEGKYTAVPPAPAQPGGTPQVIAGAHLRDPRSQVGPPPSRETPGVPEAPTSHPGHPVPQKAPPLKQAPFIAPGASPSPVAKAAAGASQPMPGDQEQLPGSIQDAMLQHYKNEILAETWPSTCPGLSPQILADMTASWTKPATKDVVQGDLDSSHVWMPGMNECLHPIGGIVSYRQGGKTQASGATPIIGWGWRCDLCRTKWFRRSPGGDMIVTPGKTRYRTNMSTAAATLNSYLDAQESQSSREMWGDVAREVPGKAPAPHKSSAGNSQRRSGGTPPSQPRQAAQAYAQPSPGKKARGQSQGP